MSAVPRARMIARIAFAGMMCLSCCGAHAGKIGDYFEEDQNIPTGASVYARNGARLLPYAYYPSVNKMDVAVQLTDELIGKVKGGDSKAPIPKEVRVRVLSVENDRSMAEGTVRLDGDGYGRALFDVPDLPDGEYRVEYTVGRHKLVSPKTFKRVHFPFENTDYGEEHEVYPPFTPVKVQGESIAVVGREYQLNSFCLFDSVKSLGRELLAAPMTLQGTTADGKPIVWSGGKVSGKAAFEDEAVFDGSIESPELRVQSKAVIGEDGCAKVTLKLLPGIGGKAIRSLKLVVPLNDKDAPLLHYIADNGMRMNYAGDTPRGGKIQWYRERWDGWVPIRWKVETPGSDDGVIIDAADTAQYMNEKSADHRPFIPYIWLGAEERGLAFFMESEKGFVTDTAYPGKRRKDPPYYEAPLNRIVRKGATLSIEVDIIARPFTLTEPREITFGFMASPGKPMEKEFRTRSFATGVGAVVCWGGYLCSSKYPDNYNWQIVDKVQETRRTGKLDRAWFEQAAKDRLWKDRGVHGKGPETWLQYLMLFAERAARPDPNARRQGSGTYFEEHAIDTMTPEWEVFQDEWASVEFNRFQDRPANWGVFAPSYQDFALHMANEWLKRGVSLYFDNTKPKRCYNVRFGPAYYAQDGMLRYGISMFAQREYYRRVYKRMQYWNQKGAPYRLDFTVHMTNTATLPFNTWTTATLDFEQRYQTAGPRVPAEPGVPDPDRRGYQLPWPPDYLRAVTFGRQAGTIPVPLDFVSGHGRQTSKGYSAELLLRNWAMARVHDIRPNDMYMANAGLARQAEKDLLAFGYGRDDLLEFNYWDEKPLVSVSDDNVKWMALVRKRNTPEFGYLLLQSFSRVDPVKLQVQFPGADSFVDVLSGERIAAKGGKAAIDMPANYSTRVFKVWASGGDRPVTLQEALGSRSH